MITSVLGFKIFNNFCNHLKSPANFIVPVKFFTPLQPSVQFLGPWVHGGCVADADGYGCFGYPLLGTSRGQLGRFGCDFFRAIGPKTSSYFEFGILKYFFRWHGSTTCMARLYNMWCFLVENLNYWHWRWGAHAFNRSNFEISHLEHEIFCKQWLTIKELLEITFRILLSKSRRPSPTSSVAIPRVYH